MSNVFEHTIEFELPITKKIVKMRFASRKDLASAKSISKADEDLELNYLGQIIKDIDGTPGPFDNQTLSSYPEKDLQTLRAYDNRLNNLNVEELEDITANFAKALKSITKGS